MTDVAGEPAVPRQEAGDTLAARAAELATEVTEARQPEERRRLTAASAAVGGAVGAWATLPVLPAFPVEIVTETLALIGIEIKLIAELHELYGMPAPGNAMDRATAYIGAWAQRRGVLAAAPGGLILIAGSPLARRLRRRLAGRVGRSAFSLGPLFTGAMAGAVLNSRETRRLGQEIRADLRRQAPRSGPPIGPPPGWEPPAVTEPAGQSAGLPADWK